jgi:hypothetical protein
VGDLKIELEALAAAAAKLEATARAVQHYVETDNLRFAALAMRVGEASLHELVAHYGGLLRRIEEPSTPI